jgi:hypothetical protein
MTGDVDKDGKTITVTKVVPAANELRRFVGWIEGRCSSSDAVLLPYRENLVIDRLGARHCCPVEQSIEVPDDSQATQVWPNRTAKEGLGLLCKRCCRAYPHYCYAMAVITRSNPEGKTEFFSDLPDVDLSVLQASVRDRLVRQANLQKCPCNCGLSLACCRNRDRSCQTSLKMAREIVKQASNGGP